MVLCRYLGWAGRRTPSQAADFSMKKLEIMGFFRIFVLLVTLLFVKKIGIMVFFRPFGLHDMDLMPCRA